MQIPFCIIAESLEGQGDLWNPQLLAKGDPKKAREAQRRALA